MTDASNARTSQKQFNIVNQMMINLILKHVKITMQDWSYGFKVVYCFDKFTKPVQTYRDEIAVYKFMAKMLDEVSMVWLAYAQAENDGGESLTEENST